MGLLMDATELSKSLIDAGNNLLKPKSSTDATLTLLDEIASLLSTVAQDPIESVQRAFLPSMKALMSVDLLKNPDSDVRVLVVSCLTDIMRITAPEAPFNDDQMKEIFEATVEAFGKLADASCRSYKKAEVILATFTKFRLSLVMLDLECDDLVLKMVRQFLKIISPDHPQRVILSVETVMITVIDEIEEVSMDLLEILLTAVKKENQDVAPTSSGLVERVLRSCAHRLQPCIMKALTFKGTSLDMYSPIVLSICQTESAAAQALNAVNAATQAHNAATQAHKEDNPGEALKMQGEELGDSSLGKLAAKKASLPTKVGKTSKSSGKSRGGSRKRKQTKMEETSNDAGSMASPPPSKKRTMKKDESEEEDCTVSDGIKNTKSSKKERAETSAKKPLADSKIANASEKKSVKSDAKKKISEVAIMDTSSKSKKKNPRATTLSTKRNSKTPKSNSNKRKRTSGEEAESGTNEHGEELVGKKVNVWWPIDMKFYEGVIDSYSSSKKKHRVSYCDGEAEELDLKNERFEIIHDTCEEDEEIDPLESVPLCDLIQKQKVKKSKNCRSLKQLSSEPRKQLRAKGRTAKKQKVARAMHQESDEKEEDQDKNAEIDGKEEQKSVKGPTTEPETDGKDCNSLKESNAELETDAAKEPIPEPKIDEEEHAVAMRTDAEPETGEKEQKPLKETNVDPKTDDEDPKVAKETAPESKTDEEDHKVAKETDAEPETDGKEQKPLKETNVEPKTDEEEPKETNAEHETDEKEQKPLKETKAEPKPEVEEKILVKEKTAATKLIEEDKSEVNGLRD
ncbi:unnamed protein product [Cochlearia groenlandica]